ncbi:hypothetical protein [Clostridium kluyveri]|nr:hypothetical protein [Clostridium kluyveri]UZQ52262.1 hypothetical protein OP486_08930 [Clostridium kluyveri]
MPKSIPYKIGELAGDIGSFAFGAAEAGTGAGGELLGFTADGTGVLAPAGVALNVASLGLVTHGGATTIKSAHNFSEDLFSLIKGEGNQGVAKAENIPNRPSWRQSELDVQSDFPDYDPQKSFIDGGEVPYGTKGSSRPDFYTDGSSIEVKNYKITTPEGRSRLINNISNQVNKRITDLPDGTSQTIIIDARGQDVSNEILRNIRDSIIEKSNTNVTIQFKR